MSIGYHSCDGCWKSGFPHNENCPEAAHNKYRDPVESVSAPAPEPSDVQMGTEGLNPNEAYDTILESLHQGKSAPAQEVKRALRIYVASSWRNEYQKHVVEILRENGHEVYDFRGEGDGWGVNNDGPGGFAWSEIDPHWKEWPSNIKKYIIGLDHPRAIEGFNRDMDALKRSDICIMVNPCGQSAHAEMGWATGAGKPVAIYCPEIREPDLMVKMADLVTNDWADISLWLSGGILEAIAETRKQTQWIPVSEMPLDGVQYHVWDREYNEVRRAEFCAGDVPELDSWDFVLGGEGESIVLLSDKRIQYYRQLPAPPISSPASTNSIHATASDDARKGE